MHQLALSVKIVQSNEHLHKTSLEEVFGKTMNWVSVLQFAEASHIGFWARH
jgi:hypothetical protein